MYKPRTKKEKKGRHLDNIILFSESNWRKSKCKNPTVSHIFQISVSTEQQRALGPKTSTTVHVLLSLVVFEQQWHTTPIYGNSQAAGGSVRASRVTIMFYNVINDNYY